VSVIDTSCTLFGQACKTPFYLSSVAKGRLVTKEGEKAFARSAAKAKTTYLVPSVSSTPLKDVWGAAAEGQHLPFQFYLLNDEKHSFEALREALALGASAVVVTVDANAPRMGAFRASTAGSTGGLFPSPSLTWRRLAEIRSLLPAHIPLYLKGVQTAEDAVQAAQMGVQGIIVSNHGGRCCGDSSGCLSALEDVSIGLRAAGWLGDGSTPSRTLELFYDSGVRSGRDALKALCLGAQGIGLGRPYYWAAACNGEDGIVFLLDMLTAELQHAMAQAGANTLGMLQPSLLSRTSYGPVPCGDPSTRLGRSGRQHQETEFNSKL